jgi:hypothetical protein
MRILSHGILLLFYLEFEFLSLTLNLLLAALIKANEKLYGIVIGKKTISQNVIDLFFV